MYVFHNLDEETQAIFLSKQSVKIITLLHTSTFTLLCRIRKEKKNPKTRGQKHSRNVIPSYFLRECDFDISLLLYSYCASQWSWYKLVRRVTRLHSARFNNRVCILFSGESFLVTPRPTVEPTQPLVRYIEVIYYPGAKWLSHESIVPHPSSTEAKNAGSYNSTLPCAFIVTALPFNIYCPSLLTDTTATCSGNSDGNFYSFSNYFQR